MNVSLIDLSQQTLERLSSNNDRNPAPLQQSCTATTLQQPDAIPKKSLTNEALTQEYKALIDWFLDETNLPSAPFQLKGAVKVLDSQKYYASLRNDIKHGHLGPRARYGALQGELRILKGLIEHGGSL